MLWNSLKSKHSKGQNTKNFEKPKKTDNMQNAKTPPFRRKMAIRVAQWKFRPCYDI